MQLDIFDEKQGGQPAILESELGDEQVLQEIRHYKEKFKHSVVILGHHYQQDDVIQFADYIGDSLQLAREVAKLKGMTYILFCGVHFMAETADMLTADNQHVILPDLNAGCSMADMARDKDVEDAWQYITQCTPATVVPITYINCSAGLKALVGREGGAICTSSNAGKVIAWALNKGEKLLFFPDQHLGRNTCFKMGIPLDQMVLYNPTVPHGGLTPDQITKAKVILWYGYCSVHQGFTAKQVHAARAADPAVTVLVHPECCFEVVQASDLAGSTSYIIKTIEAAPRGASFVVGTEINLVNRLARLHPDKKIRSLSPFQCLCTTMYRVRPRWLLEAFRSIERGKPVNIIKVSPDVRHHALKALDRMLAIV